MPNHASLLDVWMGATRLASQGMDMASEYLKHEQDTELRNFQLNLRNQNIDFLTGIDQNGDANDLMSQTQKYTDGIARQADQLKKKNGSYSSKYFQENMDTILKENNIRLRGAVAEKQVAGMRENTRGKNFNSIELLMNEMKNNPQMTAVNIEEINRIANEMLRHNDISYAEYLKMNNTAIDFSMGNIIDSEINKWIFEDGLSLDQIKEKKLFDTIDLSSVSGRLINPVERKLTRIGADGTVEEYDNPNTEGFQDDDEFMVGRKAAALKAGEQRAEAVWNTRVKQERETTDRQAEDMYGKMQEAILKGDFTRARLLITQGVSWLNNDMAGKNAWRMAANDKNSHLKDWMGLLSKLDEGKPPKKISSQKLYVDLLAQWALGEEYGGRSGNEARQLLIQELAENLRKTGEADDLSLADSFFHDLNKGIQKINPNWNNQVLKPTKSLLDSLVKDKNIDTDLKDIIYNKVAEGIIDMVGDLGLGSKTPEQWALAARDMTRIAAGMTINGFAVTSTGDSAISNLQGNFSTGNLIKTYKTLQEHPELLYQNAAGETGAIIDMSLLEGVQKQAKADIATVLRIDPKDVLSSWDAEGKNDVAPIPMIVVPNGPEKGQYKYQVNEKDELWLMKKDQDGNWGEYRKGSVAQNLAEDSESIRAGERIRDNTRIIERFKDNPNDPANQWEIQSIIDEDLYIAGINRDWTPIKKIPRDVAERIQREAGDKRGAYYYGQWESILQNWNRLGIKIEGTADTGSDHRPGGKR
jgi:hypothetical protein